MDELLRAALAEDLGAGDVTSRTAVPEGAEARAWLLAKQPGVLAGLEVFQRVFELCDPDVRVKVLARDGQRVEAGARLIELEGDARALLAAERTALNLAQRLSGIATRTAELVALARSGAEKARLLDTRKTTPLLRTLEKYAVLCGGGENHRFGLFDEVMVKENHIDLAGRPLETVLREQRAELGDGMRITAEARDAEEARAAVRGGADVVLLDNMAPDVMAALCPELRELARERDRALELEASGGIDERTIAAVAASGVDRISVGGLTHSVRSLDLSLYLEPIGSNGPAPGGNGPAPGGNGQEGGSA